MGIGDSVEHGGEAEVSGSVEKKHPWPIVEKDGVQFYAIERYGKNGAKPWTEFRPVGYPAMGNGVGTTVDDPWSLARRQLAAESRDQRRGRLAEEYDEKVMGALEAVAQLQTSIVSLANDDGAILSREEMEKLRLGLAASESILNRALGKAVTKADIDVKHSLADQMAEIDADWVVDD